MPGGLISVSRPLALEPVLEREAFFVADLASAALAMKPRGGHQTAGLNKSGSSIFGSQTANTVLPTPATAFASPATPPNA
jgi:hypothetical protein